MRLLLLLSAAAMIAAAIAKGHQMLVLGRINKQLAAIVADLWRDQIAERCRHCGKLPTDNLLGFPTVVDPSKPKNAVEFRDAEGKLVGWIINLGDDK